MNKKQVLFFLTLVVIQVKGGDCLFRNACIVGVSVGCASYVSEIIVPKSSAHSLGIALGIGSLVAHQYFSLALKHKGQKTLETIQTSVKDIQKQQSIIVDGTITMAHFALLNRSPDEISLAEQVLEFVKSRN